MERCDGHGGGARGCSERFDGYRGGVRKYGKVRQSLERCERY